MPRRGRIFVLQFLDQQRVVEAPARGGPGRDIAAAVGVANRFAPFVDREQRGIELAVEEAVRVVARVGGCELRGVGMGPCLEPLLPAPGDRPAARGRIGGGRSSSDALGDVQAAACPAGEQALGDQLLAREHDRIARHPELFGQLPRRGQPRPRLEDLQVNGLDQLLPDLRLQVQRTVGVQVKQRLEHARFIAARFPEIPGSPMNPAAGCRSNRLSPWIH